MRLHAYVLVSEPAWLRSSVESYYPFVQRIFVRYDTNGVGWNGQPLPVAESLALLRTIDTDRKIVWLGGEYGDPTAHPMHLETQQRNHCLEAAAEGCDWILQLDGDEILPHWPTFVSRLIQIDERGLDALWYPQRWIFSQISAHLWFEGARRSVVRKAVHPGPLALRSGSRVVFARQDDSQRLILDSSLRLGALRVAPRRAAIHMSWVRSVEHMRAKAQVNSHSQDYDWSPKLAAWTRSYVRPVRFWLSTFRAPPDGRFVPSYVRSRYEDPYVPSPRDARLALRRSECRLEGRVSERDSPPASPHSA